MKLLIMEFYRMGSESMNTRDAWFIHALVRPESRDCDLDPCFEIRWSKYKEMTITRHARRHSRSDASHIAHFKNESKDKSRALELTLSDDKTSIRIRRTSPGGKVVVETMDSCGTKNIITENPHETHHASKVLNKFTLLFDTLPNILVNEKAFHGKVTTAASPFRDLLIKP